MTDIIHSSVLGGMCREAMDIGDHYARGADVRDDLGTYLQDAAETQNWQIGLAALRYTYAIRSAAVFHWHHLLDQSVDICRYEGLDPHTFFIGLIPPKIKNDLSGIRGRDFIEIHGTEEVETQGTIPGTFSSKDMMNYVASHVARSRKGTMKLLDEHGSWMTLEWERDWE
jgi:hypothetical protein